MTFSIAPRGTEDADDQDSRFFILFVFDCHTALFNQSKREAKSVEETSTADGGASAARLRKLWVQQSSGHN